MPVSVSILSSWPWSPADWELQLTATAQHHERVPSGVWLAQEKMKFKILKYSFLLKAYCFHTITKSKNPKLNHHKSGTVCVYQEIYNEELAHTIMEAKFQDL